MSLTLSRNKTQLLGGELGQKTQKEDQKSRFVFSANATQQSSCCVSLTLNRNVTQLLGTELEKIQKEELKSRFVYLDYAN